MASIFTYPSGSAVDGALPGWSNPYNAVRPWATDGATAETTGATRYAWYGIALNYNLSALPDNAVITSASVSAAWWASANYTCEFLVGVKVSGSLIESTTDTSATNTWTGDLVLHPTTLSVADYKSTGTNGFYAVARYKRTGAVTYSCYLDVISVKIEYTLPVAGGIQKKARYLTMLRRR